MRKKNIVREARRYEKEGKDIAIDISYHPNDNRTAYAGGSVGVEEHALHFRLKSGGDIKELKDYFSPGAFYVDKDHLRKQISERIYKIDKAGLKYTLDSSLNEFDLFPSHEMEPARKKERNTTFASWGGFQSLVSVASFAGNYDSPKEYLAFALASAVNLGIHLALGNVVDYYKTKKMRKYWRNKNLEERSK